MTVMADKLETMAEAAQVAAAILRERGETFGALYLAGGEQGRARGQLFREECGRVFALADELMAWTDKLNDDFRDEMERGGHPE